MYRKILLAYDGSPEGHQALDEGKEVVERTQAEATLLAVVTVPTSVAMADTLGPNVASDRQYAYYEEVLEDAVAEMQARGIKTVKGRLAFGDASTQILTVAREIDADLIILGHRHQTRLARWWSGSVSYSLLDRAPCSILIAIAKS